MALNKNGLNIPRNNS